MMSLRRNWMLVTRKKISVPKNTMNWLTAGVIAATTVPTTSAVLDSSETVCPPVGAGIRADLISRTIESGYSNTRSFCCTAAPISGARPIHSVNGAAKKVSSAPTMPASAATTTMADTAAGIL